MPADSSQPQAAQRPRYLVRTIAVMVLFTGVGVSIAWLLLAIQVKPPRTDVETSAPVVKVVALSREDVTEQYVGYGTAGADRTARLAAEVSANVVERVDNIRAGKAVAKDQALIRLDHREYQLAYDRAQALATAEQAALDEVAVEREKLTSLLRAAEAELRLTESERDRVSRLFERNQAAKKEFDFANLAYHQSRRTTLGYHRELARLDPRAARLAASLLSYEAAAELAQLNVERCTIRAPFAGSINELAVDVGDRVGPGSILLTLVDLDHIEVPLQLPAGSYGSVRVGSSCDVICESVPHQSWSGTIARVAPVVDVQTRTYAAYVTVTNAALRRPLVPGTFVRATVMGQTHMARIVVPRSAIRDGVVFVMNDGKAHRRNVVTERTIVDRAVVSGGLQAGDRLILSHLDAMAEGMAVRTGEQATASDTTTDSSQPDAVIASDRVETP